MEEAPVDALAKSKCRRFRGSAVFLLVLRCVLGGIFVFAGTLKVLDPVGFEKNIENFQVLPVSAVSPLAYYLPYLEVLVGVALITGFAYGGSLVIVGGLLFVFLAALISAWFRGLDIHCGCFGNIGAGSSIAFSLVVDISLIIIWGVLCLAYIRKSEPSRHPPQVTERLGSGA